MDNALPELQVLPHQTPYNRAGPLPAPWYRSTRLIVFCIVFTLSLIISLGYVYSRPALYRSYATLLTVAQTAIDQQSSDADIQHVAIQRQILTGQELLDETLLRLDQSAQQGDSAAFDSSELSIAKLRRMLTVQAVPETNLVELAAIGYQAEILAPIINTWIDIYLQRRADEVKQSTGLTLETLREELAGLDTKILIKREELKYFREVNEITSLGRDNLFENQSLARFKALNRSFNKASEEAIKTKAQLDAINKAIGRGKTVVPAEDKKGMRVLELRLQKLREQLAEFDKKYTREYLALNPNLNVLPKQIQDLENEIQSKRNFGQNIALSDAQQNYYAAQQSLRVIKKQLDDHKQKATEFSSKFAEHESLLTDMQGLEKLQRETQERMIQIEAKQAEKFPQVKIIERAFFPRKPFSPDYAQNAIIAAIGSFILGLFSVWAVEYLTRREEHKASISISGLNIYADAAPGLINRYQQQNEQLTSTPPQSLQHEQSPKLEDDLPTELSAQTLDTLLEAADIKTRQLVCLLLSGLTLDDISRLEKEHINFDNDTISVKGEEQRTISIAPALTALFKQAPRCPAWKKNQNTSVEMLKAILVYAAIDAGFSGEQNINAESISHSYIVFLVKQGVRLSELEQITGYTDPTTLSKYTRYSPVKRGLALTEINLIHPALENL
ncbi:MAG: integrase [Gammaproteobacteria bacterium]|nr:MAG: integrase [Gammaproteobacteria bacterium]